MKSFYTIITVFVVCSIGSTQCPYSPSYLKKTKGITYDIKASLDSDSKKVMAYQSIQWTNISDQPVTELRFYMYLNAFRDMKSTFLKESKDGKIFGTDISHYTKNDWAFIHASNFKLKNSNDTLHWQYIQPDDGNINDATVLQLHLPKAIRPNEVIELDMNFVAKLSRFVVRSGYSRDDFFSFLHWFPQLGVYEKNREGKWSWNCHQFFQQTEYYADFSDFYVELDVPEHLVLGYSGCLIKEEKDKFSKRKKLIVEAKDVIDFAWIAYPYFEEYRSEWKGVEIKMLIPPEHCAMAPRYEQALRHSLDFFEMKLGKYLYPTITLMDPPIHGLGSGFMEYPMLITCASFHYVPYGIRTIESLAVHEFSHQYFMAILASNEKEEAWLDEGFVTFFEDEIMDNYYGRNNSVWDILGYKSGNKEQSRLEYTSIAKLNIGPIAKPGWEIEDGYYKQLIYAKTATVLQTLKGLIGEQKFYTILKLYYEKFQFKHPKEIDFISTVKEIVGEELEIDISVDDFFRQTLHTTDYCDYRIGNLTKIDNSHYKLTLQKEGNLFFPHEIEVKFKDGNEQLLYWDGRSSEVSFTIETKSNVVSVNIDPERKIYLDINFNNNSKIFDISKQKNMVAISRQLGSWFQFFIQSLTFLA